jgi:hypothetical protein
MRTLTALAALALTVAAPFASARAAPADDVAKLAWMSGSWIHEKGGVTTRETWLPPLGGTMAGAGQTNAPGKAPSIEHSKITAEPAGATYTAIVRGQPPVAFVLLPGLKDGEAIFENKAHDFPQRVIYRRCGEELCARIEGTIQGQARGMAWRYRRLK